MRNNHSLGSTKGNIMTTCNKNELKNQITKEVIIIGVYMLFLISFVNIYSNITLLWGNHGILPAETLIKSGISLFPSIAPFLINYNIITGETFLYLTCITGIFLSLLGIFLKSRNWIIMLLTWSCYLNIFLLGQEFMSYEWDYLLLEIGFNAIALCDTFYIDNSLISSYGLQLMQFITFKQLFGTGITMIQSKQRQWLNFTWIEALCEKQFFPTMITYYMNFYISSIIKRALAVIGMTIMIFMPFGQFFVWKRIKLFIGEIVFLFHLCLLFIGNYGMVNVMCIVINIANFNDEFFMVLYNSVQLNDKTMGKIETETQAGKEAHDESLGHNARKFLKDIHNQYYKNPNDNDDNNSWGLFQEVFVFFNLLMILFGIVFFFVFPFKAILMSNDSQGIRSDLFAQTTMNYWMILIVISIIFSVIYEHYSSIIKSRSLLKSILQVIIITILVIIYLLHSINIFYSGIGMSLGTKQRHNPFYSLIDSSYNFFSKLHCSSSYSLFKDISFSDYGRKELSIKFLLENETDWTELKFPHRPNLNESNGNIILFPKPLMQPRLDWAIEKIAYDGSINDNHVWFISLLARIFEQNKALFKELQMTIPPKEITKIKVESYIAYMQWNNTNLFMKRFNKDFLGNIEKYALYTAIEKYHLPNITQDNTTIISSTMFYDLPMHLIVSTLFIIGVSLKIAFKYI